MALRICFIGDSITNGYGDPEYRGWPAFLSAAARRGGSDITAYNLGVRGDTSGIYGTIDTSGGSAGDSGGTIEINVNYSGDIIIRAAIDSYGASGGGTGGDVSLYTDDGAITLNANIDATGGSGYGAGISGGAAG